jgi:hypothetical protein
VFVLDHLIDEPMLDVDASRECSAQVADELLERWRRSLRIRLKYVEKRLGLFPTRMPPE